ncbi:uncharacterized protein LOC110995253 [Pieris rapae]|uniref:uncharacterized protein LOC110995253 n=1 Tax=Pieris rapae TaxID=64459 RepID=UPI001E27C247|nr:uncharacterized protein LOC110995253 [Pieris rapae]
MKLLSLIFFITLISAQSVNNNSIKRKLLSYMENNVTSWSELFADFVTRNTNVFRQKTIENDTNPIPTDNAVAKIFSSVFKIFKTYVYDQLKGRKVNVNIQAEINTDLQEDKTVVQTSSNPKEDVEVIEPQYHGKLKTDIDGTSLCLDGFIKDANDNCVEVKPSKFIVSVPNHCPIGYRPDWLGKCRQRF